MKIELQADSNPAWTIIYHNLVIGKEEIYFLKDKAISAGNISKLIYNLQLMRQPLTAIVYVICPTVAISTFNIISFVLPTGEGLFIMH